MSIALELETDLILDGLAPEPLDAESSLSESSVSQIYFEYLSFSNN